jgi:hypothetical protein
MDSRTGHSERPWGPPRVSRGRRAATLTLGRFEVEIRWSVLALVAAYGCAGLLVAVAGGHFAAGGRDGFVLGAVAFVALALGAVLFHELGHAVAGLSFGRRPVGIVLKAGAAMRIEEAAPGSRGARAAAEAVVALGGPVASGLIALAYFNVGSGVGSPFAWAGLLALFDGVANLVPVFANSDGHRVVHALTDAPAPSPGAQHGGA